MSLLTQLADDFDVALNDWGEPVQYIPRADSGRIPRDITGVVDRQPREAIQGRGPGPFLTVSVKNDAITGIWSGELDNGDKISVAERVGKDPTEREILRVTGQDAGVLVLELR